VSANELTGKIGTHSMRKTFASKVYEQLNGRLERVQKALGHKNINSTVAYLSFREEDIDAAILAA
jgi:integrase